MKPFHNYQVTLHSPSKKSKVLKVRTCVSPQAAIKVAEYLVKLSRQGGEEPYRGTMVYELDADDRVIWN